MVGAFMFAARTVEVRESDAGATVITRSRYPLVAVPGFLLSGTLWLGLLVISNQECHRSSGGVVSLSGEISPQMC